MGEGWSRGKEINSGSNSCKLSVNRCSSVGWSFTESRIWAQVFALLGVAHQSSSPNNVRNFFCSDSKVAAPAIAFSFRCSSRFMPSCLTCSSRNNVLDSRESLAGALQKASRQAFIWCSNKPFSRYQAWPAVGGCGDSLVHMQLLIETSLNHDNPITTVRPERVEALQQTQPERKAS